MTATEKKSSKLLVKGKNLLNIWQTIKKPGADRAFQGELGQAAQLPANLRSLANE
jgi:hypothetical protein